MKEVLTYLVGYTRPSHMPFLGKKFSRSTSPPTPIMDHLSCFYPGMLALGVMNDVKADTRVMAENLTHTCYHMYSSSSPSHLAPELFLFNTSPGSTSDVLLSSVSLFIERHLALLGHNRVEVVKNTYKFAPPPHNYYRDHLSTCTFQLYFDPHIETTSLLCPN